MIWRCPKTVPVLVGDPRNYNTRLEMDPRLCILGLGEMIDGVVGVTKVVVRCKKMNSAEMASREAPLGKRLG